METTKLTVRLPHAELEFIKNYAREHGVTVTALIDRYFSRLQRAPEASIHPQVERIAGLIPASAAVRDLYREHVEAKHR